MDNSSNPWKGSIVPPWRGEGARKRGPAKQSCPSPHGIGTRLRVLLTSCGQSRPASSTMPTAAITRARLRTTCLVGASATISPQAVLRFSKKGTLRFDEAPNASRFTFLLWRGINPPVADFVPGVRPHGNARIIVRFPDQDRRSSGTSSWKAAPFGWFEDTVMCPSS
jgi:hypothetical protein